jgi:hypothetical protein
VDEAGKRVGWLFGLIFVLRVDLGLHTWNLKLLLGRILPFRRELLVLKLLSGFFPLGRTSNGVAHFINVLYYDNEIFLIVTNEQCLLRIF